MSVICFLATCDSFLHIFVKFIMDDCDFTINVHESDDDVFNKPNSLVKKSQKSIESKKKTFLSKSPQKKKSTFESSAWRSQGGTRERAQETVKKHGSQ